MLKFKYDENNKRLTPSGAETTKENDEIVLQSLRERFTQLSNLDDETLLNNYDQYLSSKAFNSDTGDYNFGNYVMGIHGKDRDGETDV